MSGRRPNSRQEEPNACDEQRRRVAVVSSERAERRKECMLTT